ncbi:hypothetical protein U1Q18_047729 [Sarracenia purpurea var. burkii]
MSIKKQIVMAMRRKRAPVPASAPAPASSMKSLCIALAAMILIMDTLVIVVDCRALRVSRDAIIDDHVDGAWTTGTGSFVFSFNNSMNRHSSLPRSFAFKLASGPSKKGPGN